MQAPEDAPGPPAPEAPGYAALAGHMDAPRIASLVIMAIVFVLLVMLAAAGIRRAGDWAFSRGGNTRVTAAVENSHSNSQEVQHFQRPAFVSPAGSELVEKAADKAEPYEPIIHQPAQSETEEKPVFREESREEEAPAVVSHEPAADYKSSIIHMEAALENRLTEIGRITADIHGTGRGDRDDW